MPESVTELDAYKVRVRVLEQCVQNFANPDNWSDEVGCLQWIAKRHAIEYAQEILATGNIGE